MTSLFLQRYRLESFPGPLAEPCPMFTLRIEQRPGARVVTSKLLPLSEVRSASTWENAWECVICPRLTEAEKELCGSVQKVLVNSGEF